MRWSRYFLHTARTGSESAAGPGESAARGLLARAGMIHRLGGTDHAWLPLGLSALRKLEALVRRELEAAGGVELATPSERSAAETIVDLARGELRSYRQLPLHLFRLGDEPHGRTASGVSFHATEAGRAEVGRAVEGAYRRVFAACGLEPAAVAAEGGAVAFVAESQSGPDRVLRDAGTGTESTGTTAVCGALPPGPPLPSDDLREVATPDAHTVAEVARFLGVDPRNVVKTLLYETDGGPVAALVRGDREVEEEKLRQAVGASWIELAEPQVVRRLSGAPVGFAGPVGLPEEVRVVADRSLDGIGAFVCGANRADAHLVGARFGRDLPAPPFHDLILARAGDPSPGGGGVLEAWRGVELGRVGGSVALDRTEDPPSYTDATGADRPVLVTAHELDLDRVLLAVAERHRDDAGLVWPRAVAPFEVLLVALDPEDDAVRAAAEEIYAGLGAEGVDVLLDDRDQRPGSKFHDADLLGVPVRIVIGRRSLAEGRVELSHRRDREKAPVERGDAVARALALLEK
jgi:prolyl-tRNA synthetase